MAKVAVAGSFTSNSHPLGGVALSIHSEAAMKRKTPSELRGEQLKRRNCSDLVEESQATFIDSDENTIDVDSVPKKSESSKHQRYRNTRVDEVYPVRKSSDRLRMLYQKEKAKDRFSIEKASCQENPAVVSNLASISEPRVPWPEHKVPSVPSAQDTLKETCQTAERCNQNIFRSVATLSLGSDRLSGPIAVDMDKALKGLVARKTSAVPCSSADFSGRTGAHPFISHDNSCSEFHIPGPKAPVDLTLKTSMRLVSSSSVKWCHRLSSTCRSAVQLASQFSHFGDENACHSSRLSSTAETLYSHALCTWVYPQSVLPPSVISALNSSAAEGESDFLLKRQLAWEDSFRNLYYMLRKNFCNLFYVCTSQFIVMFTGGDCCGKMKRTCNAYVSQSSRGLRSLLREYDICFSMPLCRSEVEQFSVEDLVELSEMEKCSLGQTRRLSSSDVDNSPQSLLAFYGNENVHGLYDFLLNYRSLLNSMTGVDVPLLYSPVLFQNAALCTPEVRCKEMKRVNAVALHAGGQSGESRESEQDSSACFCYSIEIKDTFLPPWIICGVCASMGGEGSFEASFTTEPTSVGLNVALETVCPKSDPPTEAEKCPESLPTSSYAFGVPEAVVAPCLQFASLRGLKYCNGSYTADISPI